MNKNKPLGIIIIAIYSALSGLIVFASGFFMLFASVIPDMPVWVTIMGIFFSVLGVFLLAAMYGLWSFQSWGLRVTKWLYVISIPLGIMSIFPIYPDSEMTMANTLMQIVGIGVAVIILYYISKPNVKTLYDH